MQKVHKLICDGYLSSYIIPFLGEKASLVHLTMLTFFTEMATGGLNCEELLLSYSFHFEVIILNSEQEM